MKDLREVDIDRITIHEPPPNQRRLKATLRGTEDDVTKSAMKSTTNYSSGNWKENTFRVGKLDVTKIEQFGKQSEMMREDSQKYRKNKVQLLLIRPVDKCIGGILLLRFIHSL